MSNVCAAIQLDEKSDFPSGTHLLVGQKVQQTLQLPQHIHIILQIGQNSVPCRVQVFASAAALVRIRRDLAEPLAIPDGIQLNMHYEQRTRKLYLGPVLGVLVSKAIKTPEGMFGSASSFCREIIHGARSKGILGYIFTLNDLNYENQTVYAWTWKENHWIQTDMPFPDAVYNRLSSRREEKSDSIQENLKQFKKMRIPFFNEHFLNKWEVHQVLSRVPQASSLLPVTEMHKGFNSFKEALSRFNHIYVKPSNGSLGKGIYRIRKNGGRFSCQYSTMSGSIQKNYSKLSDLYQSLAPKISKIPYLVQQGLNLVKINGNPLDFRSLVQKDHTGNWAVTSIVARIGQNRSIVSNLARGGTIMPVGKALMSASPWVSGLRPSTLHLKKISLQLAKALESALDGHFAELGIDLAVDIHGKVWLLEINAKPSKNDDQVLSESKTRPSVRKLLDYTLHLKGLGRPSAQKKKSKGKKR